MRAHSRRLLLAATALSATLAAALPVDAAPTGGALPPQLTLVLQIAGVGDVPVDAVGVALNVTVTDPAAAGFLTVYPCGDRPVASNLNYVADQTVPNFVISALDADGAVCIDTMTVTDVVVDLAGYLPASSAIVPLPAPQRFLDTRIALGAPLGNVRGLSVMPVPVAGSYGIPADASAVIVNATEVDPIADGYLTVAPCNDAGGAVTIMNGGTSTLNFGPGEIVPNLAVSALGAGGQLCFFSTVDAHLVADVAAYVPAGESGLVTVDRPTRVLDTRFAVGGPAIQLDSTVRAVELVDARGERVVPTEATAAIVNLTATHGSGGGYVTTFPCGQPAPLVSNVNFSAGENVANMAIVKLGPGAQLCMRAMVPVDVIVDVMGYTIGDETLVALAPTRLYDSREGAGPTCGGLAVFTKGEFGHDVAYMTRPGSSSSTLLPNQAAWDFGSRNVTIDAECHIHVTGVVGGYTWIDEYTSDGVHIRGYRPTYWGITGNNTTPTARGLFGLGFGTGGSRTVVEVRSGTTLFLLPEPPELGSGQGNNWSWLGATDDGSMIAVYQRDEVEEIEVWFLSPDGDLFGTTTLPGTTRLMDMSPDGTYLALSYMATATQDLVVASIDGTTVATLPNTQDAWFMSDGSAACMVVGGSAQLSMRRWDLFSAPTPLQGSGWPTLCRVQDVR